MNVCLSHDFELEQVVQEIKRIDAKKVLVQLPEGFKQCFHYLVEKLKENIGKDVEFLLSLNPSYGPCLTDEYGARDTNADLIIHFGHTNYPYYKPLTRTLFIPVEFTEADKNKIISILQSICTEWSRLCIVSSSQHIKLSNALVKELNKCRAIYKGTVYGCTKIDIKDCDSLVVIAGGRFLCIAQYLMYLNIRTDLRLYCIDPYTSTLWNPREEVEKLLRIRFWKIHEALKGRRWLIVSGFYGQSRSELVNTLVEELNKRGFKVFVSKVLKLDRETLINISSMFDVVVVASCPYLAFDFKDLDVPVLTIGEALTILNKVVDGYIYPW